MFDLLLRNGAVLDGTGAAARVCDVGVREGKIAAIGSLADADAQTVLDVRGKYVTPGFIDIHRHADLAVFRSGFGELELMQGLTTIVNGNCGLSCAPFGAAHRQEILGYLEPIVGAAQSEVPTQTMQAYLNAIEKTGTPVNVGMLVGAGVLRADAAGYGVQQLTDAHYDTLLNNMQSALADGAFGVSLGLGYAPECFYRTHELIRALSPLAGGSIPITVHMREEGSAVTQAVGEMLRVAQALRCPVHISHLKAMGKCNWQEKIPAVLRLLREAREQGLDVSCDVYPYTAGSTQLLHIMPPDLLRGGTDEICRRLSDASERQTLRERLQNGTDFDNISRLVGWENILLSTLHLPEHKQYTGLSIAQVAQLRAQAPEDCVFDLLASERCAITMIDFITCEQDIAQILQAERVNVISDSTYPTAGKPHPRLCGTFARILEKYVRREQLLTLPDAVHKMTQVPAQVLHLSGKGVLAVGADADINVFALETIHECATYDNPTALSAGMEYVFVNGIAAVADAKRTASRSGRVLKRR